MRHDASQVVEHLDQPELAALGPALLGRCAPRALVVTTPNIEYNLNMMVRCSQAETCRHRGVALDMEKRRWLAQQNRTEQNRTEQNRTEQNRTEQNRT